MIGKRVDSQPEETPQDSAMREFKEEVGVSIPPDKMHYFAKLEGPDYIVHVFWCNMSEEYAEAYVGSGSIARHHIEVMSGPDVTSAETARSLARDLFILINLAYAFRFNGYTKVIEIQFNKRSCVANNPSRFSLINHVKSQLSKSISPN